MDSLSIIKSMSWKDVRGRWEAGQQEIRIALCILDRI